VITNFQDFQFFHGNETGVVIGNSHRYLGVHVRFDRARLFFQPVRDETLPTRYDDRGAIPKVCHDNPCERHGRQHGYDHRQHGFLPSDLLLEAEAVSEATVRDESEWPDLRHWWTVNSQKSGSLLV
jgi:hypothetical protein